MRTKILSVIAALLLLSVAYAHFTRGIAVTIKNVGRDPILAVVIQATGFSGSLGRIDAGQSKTVTVLATGKSRVEVEHAAEPRLIVNCYFENDYKGAIIVEVSAQRIVRKECSVSPGMF